jgi:glycosyltransferase involved in cell wall biosynthesis
MSKIKMLVIPSDHTGCGYFRSLNPHQYIAEHYADEFDVDIVYQMPNGNLEEFLKQYDLIHIHKQLDKECRIMQLIKFLGIPVIIDVDDNFKLGDDHPMSLTAKKERWHEPIINHLKMADYVTTTTPIFAKELRKYNKNVAVLPNAIDPDEKQFSRNKNFNDNGGKLRVGLICGSTHLKDIEPLKGLCSLVRPNVQLYLCGFDTNGNRQNQRQ